MLTFFLYFGYALFIYVSNIYLQKILEIFPGFLKFSLYFANIDLFIYIFNVYLRFWFVYLQFQYLFTSKM